MNRVAKLFLAAGLAGPLLAGVGEAGSLRRTPPASRTIGPAYPTTEPGTATPQPAEIDARPLVWVADGAGGAEGCSQALMYANALAGNPIELRTFAWSHGYRKVILDQTDRPHSRAQGARLAEAIQERKTREPHRRMIIVAHSAGSAVALTAGDCLPPDSVDRTILLAPSVSTGYDLRPSLWAAREGLDVFCSRKDWVTLGFGVRVVGTADTGKGRAAGLLGFRPWGEAACDSLVSAKLRQHFWSAEQAWTGHNGRHFGTLAPAFIHAYLFPLIGATAK